jgi:AcrR family transcriptional regulator
MTVEPLEQGAFKRGRGGRPTQVEAERRHRSLLAAATRLFLDRGWDGTSIDEISRSSGVAKRFIYARYPDKAALFIGAVERFRENLMGEIQAFGPLPPDVDVGLYGFGRGLLDIALRPDAVALHRLFIGTASHFPELAKAFVERGRSHGLDEIKSVLAHYAEAGAITLSDPQLSAEQFFILVVGIPQRLALLIGRDEPAMEERRLRAGIALFLDGCRAG